MTLYWVKFPAAEPETGILVQVIYGLQVKDW